MGRPRLDGSTDGINTVQEVELDADGNPVIKADAPPVSEPEKIKAAVERELPKPAPAASGFVAFYNATLNPITLNATKHLEPFPTYFNLAADGTATMIPKDRADLLLKMKVVQGWIDEKVITVGAPPKKLMRAISEPEPTGELATAREKGNQTAKGSRVAELSSISIEQVPIKA